MAESPGICRVCLREGEFMISVFEYEGTLNYCHKIMHCASINISEYDGFPSSICQECRTDLAVAYDFVIKCQDSDKNLREAKPILPIKVELEVDESDGGDYPEDDVKYEDDIKDILPENSIETILYVEKKKKSRKKESKKRKIKKESKDLQCAICGLIANSRAAMIVHMRRHTGERPYKCPVCDMHFSQTGTLKVHIERRHSKEPRELRDRPFSCETCGVRFFSKRDLLVHSRRHTGDHPYACEHCSQRFTQLGSLIRHRRTHTGERPYSCTLCRKSFTDSSVLRMHQSVHSDERRFTCNICGKAVKSKNALNKHINLHREYKPIICDQCGVGFSTKGNLTLHTKKQHSERSGHCDECGKHCSDIAEHMRKHTGDTAYACNVCGKSFPLKRSLSVHMHKHINADKHKCDKENCFKTFPKKFLLDFHQLKYHSNETPFVCKICTKGYLRASDLKKHMKVHHPTFPYDQ